MKQIKVLQSREKQRKTVNHIYMSRVSSLTIKSEMYQRNLPNQCIKSVKILILNYYSN